MLHPFGGLICPMYIPCGPKIRFYLVCGDVDDDDDEKESFFFFFFFIVIVNTKKKKRGSFTSEPCSNHDPWPIASLTSLSASSALFVKREKRKKKKKKKLPSIFSDDNDDVVVQLEYSYSYWAAAVKYISNPDTPPILIPT